uniref:Uncharacterized protein n=2 Tax=Panagrolaimus sp. JU765 TaxID=591449 RepID=A0AC34Q938_9BILA
MFRESAESDQVQRRATSTPINEERDVFDSMTSFRGFDSSKENSLPPFSVGFAGATPHPATKKRSSILNTDLSNVLKKKDVEDFLRSLEKESCLC